MPILLEPVPGGSPGGRVGGFVVAAVDPQVVLAKGCVHEIAMMRLRRIGMRIRPEMPATDTHALNGNSALLLKLADHKYKVQEQLLLVIVIERGDGLTDSAGNVRSRLYRGDACIGDDNTH